MLFATTAGPLADERMPGAFWQGLRLVAVDSTCWDVADTAANEAAFGRPGNTRGPDRAAFPQVRMAALAECGTHPVLDAELGGCRTGELTLSARLVRSTGPDMLVLADREFLGVPLLRAFTASGAHVLWRVSANRVLPVQARLPDGSWLSRIHACTDGRKRDPVPVRRGPRSCREVSDPIDGHVFVDDRHLLDSR
ncbi:transposase [Streptomyces sp. NPDC026206]|uniref:transposase n=1 Tax=Streptomyces sp. NPDC026206 TaxID=3157089 RepID=UPI0033E32BCD